MIADIFTETPNELKTIEVDVEKKVFKVNGVDFGRGCTFFSISCEAGTGFNIRMEINTTVELAGYGMNGKKKTDRSYTLNGQLTSDN